MAYSVQTYNRKTHQFQEFRKEKDEKFARQIAGRARFPCRVTGESGNVIYRNAKAAKISPRA